MAERSGMGCLALALAFYELVALAAISLNWWFGSWDPEDVGDPAGPYVLKVAVLAAIAVVAGAMAARAGHVAIVWSQVVIVLFLGAVMLAAQREGADRENERRLQVCRQDHYAKGCEGLSG
ncbi:DUF6234 family protein [Streptomyces sp. NEAU-Y11]|uniref:DUF6234 family protein n=1 Tax=Streptomyces cucumeris TaxID=2962890 RepID=UPI0020C861F4|nr:DUF6234 family protein [Streptomyces sp. NEAU-Y11]MCP9206917.1 DUF6234 family protein [Streptomyces sp. NEAU-Y11]